MENGLILSVELRITLEEPVMRTLIDGGFVVAFDGKDHRIVENGSVVFEGNEVVHVGKSYQGGYDEKIEAKGKLVIPGLISMHTHATIPSCERLLPDIGRKDFFGSGVFNCIPLSGSQDELKDEPSIGVEFALADAIRHGCTTMVEVGRIGNDELLNIVGKSGIRAYVGPGFKSCKWSVTQEGKFEYLWDEQKGFNDLKYAVRFIKEKQGSFNERISGMLYPMQADTCTSELLSETKKNANQLGVKIQIHAAQNLLDFHETLRRYKKTPLEYLSDAGVLDKNLILGHCIFISGHSWTSYPGNSDLRLLVNSKATVAHCPLVYARRGIRLESFQRYLDAGVNVTIGMDTYPRDILSEMRVASLVSKVVDQDYSAASAAEVFRSATLRAAQALGRSDIGRICKGSKADIVIIDLKKLHIGPVIDPIKTLINCANGQDVDTVIVDGEKLVEKGHLTRVNESTLMEKTIETAEKSWDTVPNWHWAGMKAKEICIPSYKKWDLK